MKAEKEPEEFEFGCEDLTKDWLDEISDLEEQEEKSECDENNLSLIHISEPTRH